MTDLKPHERALLRRIQMAGAKGLPAVTAINDAHAITPLREQGLIVWRSDLDRWFTPGHEPARPVPTEATVSLDLSEYEASIITGALVEFGERWPEETHTAGYLRKRVRAQLPSEWTDGDE